MSYLNRFFEDVFETPTNNGADPGNSFESITLEFVYGEGDLYQ